MINPKDLRIGNFICDDEGVLAKIIGFAPFDHSIRCDEEEGCKLLVDCYHANGARRSGCETDSPECNPIPLTLEWLERMGFKKVPNGVGLLVLEGYVEISSLFTGFPLTLGIDGSRMPLHQVKYVHQLQNLYFALTGEDLEIKMETA